MYLSHFSELGKAMEEEFGRKAVGEGMGVEERVSAYNAHVERSGQLTQNAEDWGREMQDRLHAAGRGRGRGDKRKLKWLVVDFEAGDVLFHNPYMVHGAARNEDEEGVIRLSTDLRFHEEGSDLDPRLMGRYWNPDDGL